MLAEKGVWVKRQAPKLIATKYLVPGNLLLPPKEDIEHLGFGKVPFSLAVTF